ncbi:MAG: putative quinol monooxygenase [Actinomycetes bacterium]
MLIISGIITFDPSKQAEFIALAAPLVEATLAEPGNITYGFWFDGTDPGRVRAYEEWESEEAIGSHMATAHMASFLEGMASVGVTGASLHQHVVTDSTKVM